MAKETYYYGKRDLLLWQKRPTTMAKETYYTHMQDVREVSGDRAYIVIVVMIVVM
jgi:hypothetical protein